MSDSLTSLVTPSHTFWMICSSLAKSFRFCFSVLCWIVAQRFTIAFKSGESAGHETYIISLFCKLTLKQVERNYTVITTLVQSVFSCSLHHSSFHSLPLSLKRVNLSEWHFLFPVVLNVLRTVESLTNGCFLLKSWFPWSLDNNCGCRRAIISIFLHS